MPAGAGDCGLQPAPQGAPANSLQRAADRALQQTTLESTSAGVVRGHAPSAGVRTRPAMRMNVSILEQKGLGWVHVPTLPRSVAQDGGAAAVVGGWRGGGGRGDSTGRGPRISPMRCMRCNSPSQASRSGSPGVPGPRGMLGSTLLVLAPMELLNRRELWRLTPAGRARPRLPTATLGGNTFERMTRDLTDSPRQRTGGQAVFHSCTKAGSSVSVDRPAATCPATQLRVGLTGPTSN